jgi:hypothetical protein
VDDVVDPVVVRQRGRGTRRERERRKVCFTRVDDTRPVFFGAVEAESKVKHRTTRNEAGGAPRDEIEIESR